MSPQLKKKLENYKVPDQVKKLIRDTKIVFLVGVSAAGKDTIRTKLLLSDKYHHIVSHTTRTPRTNHGVMEQDGLDYHFRSYSEIERMLDDGEFVEAKIFSGNIYGTSVAEIQKAYDDNKIAITDLEVQGVTEYKSISDSVVPIFLLPPNYKIWQKRLIGRYTANDVDPSDIKKRMRTAMIELEEALEKPYFEYVVNEDLHTTINIVDEIAHGEFSKKKNKKAREIARELLSEIEASTLDL